MNLVPDSKSAFPELRELIRVARAYVAGDVHFSYVCAAAATARDAAGQFTGDERLCQMARDWTAMSLRVWPELARISNPITEAEYRAWVQRQLIVFEPMASSTHSEQA